MTSHIAIMSHKSLLDKIFAGEKTVESRFSRVKSAPFGQIAAGDQVFFKLSGGPVLGHARVGRVEEYDHLTPPLIVEITTKYQKELALSEDFLARKMESKFASLLFLEDVETSEPWTYKQDGRSGWIVLVSADAKDLAHHLPPMPLATYNNQEDSREDASAVNNLRMTGF